MRCGTAALGLTLVLGVRSITEIRDRGKWQSEVSCSRYRQAGRYQLELNKLTAEQLSRADRVDIWGLHFLIRLSRNPITAGYGIWISLLASRLTSLQSFK